MPRPRRLPAWWLLVLASVLVSCYQHEATAPPEGGGAQGDAAIERAAAAFGPPAPPPTATSGEPCLLPGPWSAPPEMLGLAVPPLSALAAAVLDESSGQLLVGKDASRPLSPASLTKIATAIVAIEQADLDGWVTSDVDSRAMGRSTVMGLLPGDRFTLRDLLYGLMLPSGNDAALAIGRHVAGSDKAFVARMNALASRLGLRDTRFANPHGLSARDHYSSARDLASSRGTR